MPLLIAASPTAAPQHHSEAAGISCAVAAERALDLWAKSDDDRFLARLRLRQQLLRLTSPDIADPAILAAEAGLVLDRIRRDQQGFAHWHRAPPENEGLPRIAGIVRSVPDDVTGTICERFHYVGTPREGIALGLYTTTSRPQPPATLLLFSTFDLACHRDALPAGLETENVLLLSRIYTFRWAPRNAFSYCWSRALPVVRQLFPAAALVLTSLDPNPGFTAISYLAANWVPFATESTAEYLYLDGQHLTRRELEMRFGTGDPAALRRLLGERLAAARQPLAPLELWAFPLRRSVRRSLLRSEAAILGHP